MALLLAVVSSANLGNKYYKHRLGGGWMRKMKTAGLTGVCVPTAEDLQTSLSQRALRGAGKFLRDAPILMLGLVSSKTV